MDSSEVLPHAIVYGAMHNNGKWYIGSTGGSLNYRRHTHYADVYAEGRRSNKFYDALRATEEDEWIWGVHEDYENITRRGLLQQEDDYQQAFGCFGDGGYNTQRAVQDPNQRSATCKAYRLKNIEKLKATSRQYYQDNKQRLQEYAHAQYAATKDATREVRNAQHRAWHAGNKDRVNVRRRELEAADRDGIVTKRKQRKAIRRRELRLARKASAAL